MLLRKILKKVTIGFVLESKLFPFILSLSTSVAYFFIFEPPKQDSISNILSAAINVTAILTGSFMAMISILAAISDKSVMKKVARLNKMMLIKYLFRESTFAGIFTAIISTICLSMDMQNKWLFSSWLLISSYFVFSSLRLVEIMLNIIIAAMQDEPKIEKVKAPGIRKPAA